MFNLREKNVEERKPREYKGTRLFVIKPSDIDIELYLDIILRNIEGYVRQEHKMPEYIRLTYDNYSRIIDYNHTIVEKRDGRYFIFGVEVEL